MCFQSLLCAEGESCTGYGGGQVQAFGDLPPDLLIDYLNQASFLCYKFIKLIEIQDLLCHDRDTIHWCTCGQNEGVELKNAISSLDIRSRTEMHNDGVTLVLILVLKTLLGWTEKHI